MTQSESRCWVTCRARSLSISLLCFFVSHAPACAQDIGAVADGNWNDASTWTAGGPPGAGDNAYIGSGIPVGTAAVAVVTMSSHQTVSELSLGRDVGTQGTLNLNAQLTVTDTLFIGRFGNGIGTVNHGGGNFVADQLNVFESNNFTFDAGDVATNLGVFGAAVNTTATGNITNHVQLNAANGLLTLGANLELSEDLDIRGLGATPATVDAGGNDITARDIFVGRFGVPGILQNDGQITATRDFEVGGGTHTLDANDSVADTVAASFGGVLTLHDNTTAANGFVGSDATLNVVNSGNVSQSMLLNGANGTLDLTSNLNLTADLDIRGSTTTPATVRANGNDITARDIFIGRFGSLGSLNNDGAIVATRDLEVSGGTFALDADDTVADTVAATVGGTLTLHPDTAAQSAFVSTDATLNTLATSNLSRGVQMNGANGTLDLGADLFLTEDLDIRGANVNPATLRANGNDITARDIFIGRFGNAGSLMNDGAVVATRDLEVSGGTFTMDANDAVADTVRATAGGTLTLHANTAVVSGLVTTDATLHMVATNNISRDVLLNGANGTLDLSVDLVLTEDLDIRGANVTTAMVQANGNNIFARDIFIGRFGNAGNITNDGAIVATRDLEVSGGTFALDANDAVADTVAATQGGTLTLHANTAADDGLVTTNATLHTASAGNISNAVLLNGASATLNLGGHLNLTQDIDIRGVGATAANLQANGFNVSAGRDIFVGRFGQRGSLADTALLTVGRNLVIDRSDVQLDGGLDSVGNELTLFSGSTLGVNQDADTVRGLSLEGSTLEILDTSVMNLSFDNHLSNVADWVFRWAGDHVTDINTLIGGGQITVSANHPFIVVHNDDGYTYIANFQADFNGDDRLGCDDIDALTLAIVTGSTDLMFDLTNDGVVDIDDRDEWLAGAGAAFLASGNPYFPADANLDGIVDGQDFIVWNQNRFTPTPAFCSGDFNADGVVDGLDFIIWNTFRFQAADAVQVPEPNAAVLLCCCLLAFAKSPQRR